MCCRSGDNDVTGCRWVQFWSGEATAPLKMFFFLDLMEEVTEKPTLGLFLLD